MTTKILISNNPAALKAALAEFPVTATVEAEYGDILVHGNFATLAHHGPRSGNPCPCLGQPFTEVPQGFGGNRTIGISHFDLDTLGGVMRILNLKDTFGCDGETLFWQIAAEVDTRGVHKLAEIRAEFAARNLAKNHGIMQDSADYLFECEWDDAIESLNAFWAWSESNRLFPPSDGSVLDVTEFFRRAIDALTGILSGDAESLLDAGVKWAESKSALNKESLITVYGDWDSGTVALRRSKQFVNHLYELPGGGRETYKAIVGFNPERKAITVSLADPIEGLPVAQFVQVMWPDCLAIDPKTKKPLVDTVFPHPGDALRIFPDADIQFLAGGRDVIAGSPRGREMTMDDAYEAAEKLAETLQK